MTWNEYNYYGLTIQRTTNIPRGGVCKFIATDKGGNTATINMSWYQGGQPSPEEWANKGLVVDL